MYSFPPGITIKDIKGYGTSGMTALIPNTQTIIKFPVTEQAEERERCNKEKSIYQLFQSSPHKRPTSLLQYEGNTEDGILLEYAENGPLRLYLQRLHSPLPISDLLRWAGDAAQALRFVHLNGVSHGDVNCTNCFLNEDLEIKLGDFTSSFIYPVIPEHALQEDFRDFGSTLFEMEIGCLPYPGLSTFEREEALLAGRYPDTTQTTVLGHIILRCWKGEYKKMEDIIKDIDKAGSMFIFRPKISC
jgi:serine/threonine protein kinase